MRPSYPHLRVELEASTYPYVGSMADCSGRHAARLLQLSAPSVIASLAIDSAQLPDRLAKGAISLVLMKAFSATAE
jgi:hypothetical protein